MELKIEKMDHLGNGIGFINNKICFVPFTIAGDTVEIEIIKENKNFINAKLLKIIEPSEDRIKAFCPYYGLCGGCSLQNYSYEKTLDYKVNRVKNILNRVQINNQIDIIPNSSNKFYRNKIELKVRNKKIGYYAYASHDLIEISLCMITKKCINDFINEIIKMDIINGDVTIRCNYNDELLISIKSEDKLNIKNDYSSNKVVGIIVNDKLVYGENHFLDKVGSLFFEVSYDAFFQVNSYINEELFKIISKEAAGQVVLDLYSGVGTLSIMASQKAEKVYAIEVIPNAVINALKNAKINNINNIHFILGKVEDKIQEIKDNIDTIIVDPPRKGLDNFTIKKLLEINPNKIIYISCETQKLSEDLKQLLNNYYVKKITCLDMFSFSYHVESVCILERR